MGKSTVDWNSQETWQRVVAAIIATGVKIDYREVALHFGTTYDTIENRFRKIKKEAIVLKEEVEDGERGESTPARKSAPAVGTPKKCTPKKDALATVTSGRVSKSATPKNRKSAITQEAIESDLTDAPVEDGLGDFGHYTETFNTDDLSDFLV